MRIKGNTTQLASQVAEKLLYEMTEGKYASADRLPPETTVAEEIGVSRTALRDGSSILEREGFITRKWGQGTLINRHVLGVRTRIDIENEFLDMIRRSGFEGAFKDISYEWGIAGEDEAYSLRICEGDPVIRVHRTATADHRPAILCTDIIAKSWINDLDFPPNCFDEPIFDFLKEYCGTEVFMDVTEIHSVNAYGIVAEKLDVPEGTAVLHLDEVGYDVFGKPVLLSKEYYREGLVTHYIIRKKI